MYNIIFDCLPYPEQISSSDPMKHQLIISLPDAIYPILWGKLVLMIHLIHTKLKDLLMGQVSMFLLKNAIVIGI